MVAHGPSGKRDGGPPAGIRCSYPRVESTPMSAEYPMFALSEEHQAIREAVRDVCDAKVAPFAAAVDEAAEFPQAAYDALAQSDFAAPHIAEEYGGAGADALATAIVIEEVARADVS